MVAVTDHAADLKRQIVGTGPSTIESNSHKPAAILAEDKIVGAYDIGLRPEDVEIVPVEKIFQ